MVQGGFALRLFSRDVPVAFASDPICAVVAAPSARVFLREVRAALRVATTCELRLDWLANGAEIERVIAALPRAIERARGDAGARGAAHRAAGKICVIATLRRRDGGGRFAGSRSAQLKFLMDAAAAGCNWCDIELPAARRLSEIQRAELRGAGARLLISFHDFRRTPRDLAAVISRLDRCDGDAIKIATQCNSLSDSARVLATARGRSDVVAVPMGEAGFAGRILALRSGSALAYASVKQATAPGQLSVREMREIYRADKIRKSTRVFAIIGDPVAHSLSPIIHNAGYLAQKRDALFIPVRVESLRDFLIAAAGLSISGFAVTIPFKQMIVRHLAKCDALAARIAAVNTVVAQKNGRLSGYNTDYIGVLRAIEPQVELRSSRVLILGAGGAARAAAFALSAAGASVRLWSRRFERARALAHDCGALAIRRRALRRSSFTLIINATPVGMDGGDRSPVTAAEINCGYAMDMIYNPLETAFLKMARRRGCRTISGLDMFIAQAAAQWEIWWGVRAPVRVMRAAALGALRGVKRKT